MSLIKDLKGKGGICVIWIVVAALSTVAGLIQTVTGFGAVVLMMLVLPYFFPIVDASTLSLTIALVLCIVLCWQYRQHIPFRTVLPPTIVYTIVNYLVLQVVDRVNTGSLELVFALFLIALSVYYLFMAKKVRLAPKPIVGIACGAFSGTTAAFFAIGGPPMAIYFLAATKDHYSYVASMQFMFVITTIAGLLSRAASGLYQLSFLPYAALGTAGMLVGMKLGKMVMDRLNADLMRRLAYLFVGISGLIFLLQSLG